MTAVHPAFFQSIKYEALRTQYLGVPAGTPEALLFVRILM